MEFLLFCVPMKGSNSAFPRLYLMQGGIVYSNNVVMISTPYGNAKMTKENSHGLESTLTIHK
jgi:glycogen synthase